MLIALNCGHCKSGTTASGAVGYLNESDENRVLGKKIKTLLEKNGHIVIDATVDRASSASACLKEAVSKANAKKVDLSVSIHFNAGVEQANGTEVFIYSSTSKSKDTATRVVNNLASIGFKNRGVKTNSSLYWLKNTNSPSILIETCFVSNKSDSDLYKKRTDDIARAIVEGILGKKVLDSGTSSNNVSTSSTSNTSNKTIYRVIGDGKRIGSYSVIDNTLNEVKKLIENKCTKIEIEKV